MRAATGSAWLQPAIPPAPARSRCSRVLSPARRRRCNVSRSQAGSRPRRSIFCARGGPAASCGRRGRKRPQRCAVSPPPTATSGAPARAAGGRSRSSTPIPRRMTSRVGQTNPTDESSATPATYGIAAARARTSRRRSIHSITSSALACSVIGTLRPSAFAVLRLITRANLVGACTGRSAGFSPLRMRST